jgi:exonuclease V gamma subunit
VIAEGPVRCVEISRDQLMHTLEADPRAATALIAVLASRFRESS